jgi:nitrogen PTS system EIIA component
MAMDIKEFLAPSDVFIGIRGSNKTQLLEDLCRRAASTLKVDADKITADILKREELGSTGMGGGVAIPHARIADVKKPFGIFVPRMPSRTNAALSPSPRARLPTPVTAKAGTMPTHERFRADNRENVQD